MTAERYWRSAFVRFGVAAAVIAVAAAARIAMNGLLDAKFPLITFYPAVMISAWFGGFWPGILSTLLAWSIADYLWLAPIHSLRITNSGDAVAGAFFLAIGAAISFLNENLHRGRERE